MRWLLISPRSKLDQAVRSTENPMLLMGLNGENQSSMPYIDDCLTKLSERLQVAIDLLRLNLKAQRMKGLTVQEQSHHPRKRNCIELLKK